LTRPNTEQGDISDLNRVIKNKYPSLDFEFLLLHFDKHIYRDHLLLMKLDENDDEIKRLGV